MSRKDSQPKTMPEENQKGIIKIITALAEFMKSDEIKQLAGKKAGNFTRSRKLPLFRLLLYLIFRHTTDTPSDLAYFFGSIDENESQPSRQALFSRLRCLRPEVWLSIMRKFVDLFYSIPVLVRTLKGYVVAAIDSSACEVPYSEEAKKRFGLHRSNHIKAPGDSPKTLARCGGILDCLNRIFMDYTLYPYDRSEMSIILEQLKSLARHLVRMPMILLGDRGYISLQLMVFCQMLGFKFCFRAKRSTYKKEVGGMHSDDEYVHIRITKAILSRITLPEVRSFLESLPFFEVRVVKSYWTNPKTGARELAIYFTNLSPEEFNTKEIIDLYGLRWNIEVAYKIMKEFVELERNISRDVDTCLNTLYGKITYFNLTSLYREQFELLFTQKKENLYEPQVNSKQMGVKLHAENLVGKMYKGDEDGLKKIILDINVVLNQYKVPIRPGRSYNRWGRRVLSSRQCRFRLDGRNEPKVALASGVLRTVRP